jgi:phage gp36-like protein
VECLPEGVHRFQEKMKFLKDVGLGSVECGIAESRMPYKRDFASAVYE